MPVQMAQLFYGAVQADQAKEKAGESERKLERMQNPTYKPNQSILDFYQSALQKYNVSPTDSAQYKRENQQIKQGTVQGLNALRDRRLGGGVSSIINNQNNALLKSAVNGENRKSQEFSILGHAAGMKAQEEGKAFNYNQIAPFEKNYNLTAMKAAGQNQVYNSNIGNIFNAASNLDAQGNQVFQQYGMPAIMNRQGKNKISPQGGTAPPDYNYLFKGYGSPTGLNY